MIPPFQPDLNPIQPSLEDMQSEIFTLIEVARNKSTDAVYIAMLDSIEAYFISLVCGSQHCTQGILLGVQNTLRRMIREPQPDLITIDSNFNFLKAVGTLINYLRFLLSKFDKTYQTAFEIFGLNCMMDLGWHREVIQSSFESVDEKINYWLKEVSILFPELFKIISQHNERNAHLQIGADLNQKDLWEMLKEPNVQFLIRKMPRIDYYKHYETKCPGLRYSRIECSSGTILRILNFTSLDINFNSERQLYYRGFIPLFDPYNEDDRTLIIFEHNGSIFFVDRDEPKSSGHSPDCLEQRISMNKFEQVDVVLDPPSKMAQIASQLRNPQQTASSTFSTLSPHRFSSLGGSSGAASSAATLPAVAQEENSLEQILQNDNVQFLLALIPSFIKIKKPTFFQIVCSCGTVLRILNFSSVDFIFNRERRLCFKKSISVFSQYTQDNCTLVIYENQGQIYFIDRDEPTSKRPNPRELSRSAPRSAFD